MRKKIISGQRLFIIRALVALIVLVVSGIAAYGYIRHEVKRSETLWGLAHKYGVKPEDIEAANPQVKKGIKTGMILLIPEESDGSPTTQDAVNTAPDEAPVTPHAKDNVVTSDDFIHSVDSLASVRSVEIVDEGSIPKAYTSTDIEYTNIYFSKFGDTMSSLSTKTGVSEDKLIKYNPFIESTHIPEGTAIRLTADAPYIVSGLNHSLSDSIIYNLKPQQTPVQPKDKSELTIAVMLPFDVDEDVIPRQSLLVTDFYKGFLMAVQESTSNGNLPLKIIAIDTQCDSITFDERLQEMAKSNVSIIIPPEDERQLAKIDEFALANNILVINTLSIKDDSYIKYPNVLQCNISQALMYDKAIQSLLTDHSEYIPVVLDLYGGRDEKSSFIEAMKAAYDGQGRKVITIPFKNKLEESDLSTLSPNEKYIFLTKSGSVEVFNRISDTVLKLIEDNVFDQRYRIFGYPDWVAYRGENEEALHRMGAYIYSRFYTDPDDYKTETVIKDFNKWYGTPMEEVYPSQGLLGYDTGKMIFWALDKKWTDDDLEKFKLGTYDGRQSSFHFIDADTTSEGGEGIINDALYIIEYLPGTTTYAKTL